MSGGGRRHPRPVDWAGEMVSFSLFREALDILLFNKKKIKFYFFFNILNSIYFQAIQTAVFYQNNTYKNFRPNFLMFIDHRVSCDQNKSLSLGKTDYWKVASKSW